MRSILPRQTECRGIHQWVQGSCQPLRIHRPYRNCTQIPPRVKPNDPGQNLWVWHR
jgi:hypothetical protein